MPPENPYAAPQVLDAAVTDVPELAEELLPSLESIRTGAQLALKATWLVFLAVVVVGLGVALEILETVPLMLWILLGAAAFCHLTALLAFLQVTPAAGIRRWILIAVSAFVVSLMLILLEDWVLPPREPGVRLAWNALNNLVSLTSSVTFLAALARLGRVLPDPLVTRWAMVAAWAWGAFYVIVGGVLLLGALSANLREQLRVLFMQLERSGQVTFLAILGLLVLVGLFGYLRALWRLKKITAG